MMDDVLSPFIENNNNYVLAAHFESDDDNNENGNGIGDMNKFNNKKKFDDYFNEPDEIDMI